MLSSGELLAIGTHASIYRVAAVAKGKANVVLAHSETTGVVGPLAPPKGTTWLGLGKDDAVLAATKDGALWRAPDVAAAAEGRFAPLAKVAGARTWDASGDVVVATSGKRVWISRDAGATFVAQARPRALDGGFVRPDGAIVLDPKGATPEVSRDGGATWTSAPAAVGELVVRRLGDWLGEREADRCVGGKACKRCHSGVLASDGTTWLGWPEQLAQDENFLEDFPAHDWEHVFWPRNELHVADEPPAPITAPLATDARLALATVHGECEEGRGRFGIGRGTLAFKCVGVDCVGQLDPRGDSGATTTIVIFNDHRSGGAHPRSPTVAIVDKARATVLVTPSPKGCTMDHFEDLGGAALVACKDGPLYLVGKDGTWHLQKAAPMAIDFATRTEGGAILIGPNCARHIERCAAQFKPAAALGEGAFVALTVPNARAFRLGVDGTPFAVAARPQPKEVTKTWELPIYEDSYLGNKILTAAAQCFYDLPDARQVPGEVVFTVVPAGKSGKVTELKATNPALDGCFRQALKADRLAPIEEPFTKTVTFRNVGQRAEVITFDTTGQPRGPSITFVFDGNLRSVGLSPAGFSVVTSVPAPTKDDRNATEDRHFKLAADGTLTPQPSKDPK